MASAWAEGAARTGGRTGRMCRPGWAAVATAAGSAGLPPWQQAWGFAAVGFAWSIGESLLLSLPTRDGSEHYTDQAAILLATPGCLESLRASSPGPSG